MVLEVAGISVNTGKENTAVAVEIVQLSSDLRKQSRTDCQSSEDLLVSN